MGNHTTKDTKLSGKTINDNLAIILNNQISKLQKSVTRMGILLRGGYTLYHFRLSIDRWKPRIQLINHFDVAKETENRLNVTSKTVSPEKFVFRVLQDRSNYDFVIFITDKDKNFVQFWTAKGNIDFNFPMVKTNGLKGKEKAVIKLLEQHAFEFLQTSAPKTLKYLQYTTTVTEDGMREIYANFGRNIVLASHFTASMFNDIYKEKITHLKVKLG